MTMTNALIDTVIGTVGGSRLADYRDVVRAGIGADPAGEVASPVMPFVLSTAAFDALTASLRPTDPAAAAAPLVHLSQEIQVHRLVRPGDRPHVTLGLSGARREARGVRLAMRCRVSGADDEPIADLVTAVLLVGATEPAAFGEMHTTAAPIAHGDPLDPQLVVHRITTETVRSYARVSGDANPIHLDDDAAVAAGFPGAIAHGMSVLALICEDVVDRYAGGDPAQVRALSCRFSGPVLPGEPIEVRYAGTGDVVTFSCRTPRGAALKSGWLSLGPAPLATGGPR